MLIKKPADCQEITANDGCRVRELLHPAHDPVNLPYSLAIARLAPGMASYAHYLLQPEVYYILEGQGRMHIGDETAQVSAGEAVVIPAGCPQWIENAGNSMLVFAAIVSPPWRSEDDVRLP